MERRQIKRRLVVLAAHDRMQRVNDVTYDFEQESHFFWLTGIREPGWQVIIDGFADKAWLVAPHIESTQALFDGALSYEEARRISGIKTIIDLNEAKLLLHRLAEKYPVVDALGPHPYHRHLGAVLNPAPTRLWRSLKKIFLEVRDCRTDFAVRRANKTADEIKQVERAVDVSIKGFQALRHVLTAVRFEYELEAELTYAFRKAGADGHAYEPIVASGKNALTLHYTNNNDRLPKNGLVLIDAGARVNGYCADITRTYAVGMPTERQRAVHGAVETAHHQIIARLGPGKSVKEYHEQVDEIMKATLDSLGLLKHPDDYRKYFPHAVSHGLGIDVHDSLGRPTHFMPGMVLTVEPGIYIPEEGIGVRIEDDILITKIGHRNLSGELPTSL